MVVITRSTGETKEFAEKLASKLKPGNVLALYGDLGSGKTTFTGYLVNALGIKSRVQSPTFVLHRKYKGDGLCVNHFDFYRLKDTDEIFDTGLLEALDEKDAISIIEWPELAEEYLPEGFIVIKFEYKGENERRITVQNLH